MAWIDDALFLLFSCCINPESLQPIAPVNCTAALSVCGWVLALICRGLIVLRVKR